MRSILIVLVALFIGFSASAQDHFTYQTDHTFSKKEDFIGVEIIPSAYQRRDGGQGELDLRENTFLMTPVYFIFKEDGEEIRYTVNSLQSTNFGFQGILMDIKNPTNQAKVKYILTNRNHLAAVIFKPGTKAQETIYTLPELDKTSIRKEANHFTTKDLLIINGPAEETIWNTEIKPFFEQSNYKRRLFVDDKITFEFKRDTTSTTETKKGPKYTFSDSFIYKLDGEEVTASVSKTKAKELEQGVLLTFDLSDPVDGNFSFPVFVNKNSTIENIDFKGKRYLLRDKNNMPDKYPLVVQKKKVIAPKIVATPVSPEEETIMEDDSDVDIVEEEYAEELGDEDEEEYFFEEEEEEETDFNDQDDRLEGLPDWFNIQR